MFQLVPIVSGSAPLKSTFLTIHPLLEDWNARKWQ